MLELQAEQCQQAKRDPELHRAAPQVTLPAKGLGNQEVKQDKASQTVLLLPWNSAGSNHPEGTAKLHPTQTESKKGKYFSWTLLLLPTKEQKHVVYGPLLVRV